MEDVLCDKICVLLAALDAQGENVSIRWKNYLSGPQTQSTLNIFT